VIKFLERTIATFLGLGFFPIAPGTLTSLAVVLAYKLSGPAEISPPWFAAGVVVLFFLGSAASTAYSRDLGQRDPGRIVIDEACGQLIALFRVPGEWAPLAVSFFLFRALDIIKPFPIRRLERLPRGWGIMADDVAAGILAGLGTHLYLLFRG
jgi:phosphatidylglycerophosphatase A